MHVSGDRASENADAVGATNNINAVGTNVCAARSSGNYLLPVGSRSRLRANMVFFTLFKDCFECTSIEIHIFFVAAYSCYCNPSHHCVVKCRDVKQIGQVTIFIVGSIHFYIHC